MQFLAPLAFALAALLPVIIAMYFLKLRREEQVVSSTWLWREMVRDVAANAPWQRLRFNWLLLLQLLFLLFLIGALARPFIWKQAATGSHMIAVLDTSASMAATDVQPNRLQNAIDQLENLVADLPDSVPVTLIEAGSEVQIRMAASVDRRQLRRTLDELTTGFGTSDMVTALELAGATAAGDGGAQIVVLSDGGVDLPERLVVSAEISYIPIGEGNFNQAISVLSLDADSVGQEVSAFVRVTNYGFAPASRRLVLTIDGQLFSARDLTIPTLESVTLTIPDIPPGTRTIEATLSGSDMLSSDDRAWAIAPQRTTTDVTIVGPGNRFLNTALGLLPGIEVNTISLEDYEVTMAADSADLPATADNVLTIFDSVLPESDNYPEHAILFLAPLRSTPWFSVTGSLEAPELSPAGSGDGLLRYVDVASVAVQSATQTPLPTWGRPVIVAADSQYPLLTVGDLDGQRLALLSFDLRQSDLPLRVAFPLLLANLVEFLVPGTTGAVQLSVAAGEPIVIPTPALAEALIVQMPDGTLRALSPEDGDPVFGETGQVGVYQLRAEVDGQMVDFGRFAVNSGSRLESDIMPKSRLEIAQSDGSSVVSDEPVRQEWWRPIAWIALAILLIEWLVQHRARVRSLFASERRMRSPAKS